MFHGINEHRKREIVTLLSKSPMTARELGRVLKVDSSVTYVLLQHLIEANKIKVAGYTEIVKGKSKVYEVCT